MKHRNSQRRSFGAEPSSSGELPISRRALVVGGAAATVGLAALPWLRRKVDGQSPVFIARNQAYGGPLEQTIRDGLLAIGIAPKSLAQKRVLLKPNLVEPTRLAPHLTTHPAVLAAAAAVFRKWGANVTVGEAPGHLRDTELAIAESGTRDVLDDLGLDFADLNYEKVEWVANRGGASDLPGFYFPRSVVAADLIVSLPKMKTHHWVGFTGALKNLYGVIPGCVYGWPKNVLHHAGIPQTVFDINATLPKSLAIVDGIVAMEGDGPIMGTPKAMGLVIVGANLTAVDATIARIMGLAPERVSYLALAADRLGPVRDRSIGQLGESWQSVADDFQILPEPHLAPLRASAAERLSSKTGPALSDGAAC